MTPCRASSRVALRRCAGPAGRRPGGGKARPDAPEGRRRNVKAGRRSTAPARTARRSRPPSPPRPAAIRCGPGRASNATPAGGRATGRSAWRRPGSAATRPWSGSTRSRSRASRATPACWASPRTERRTGSTRGTGRRPKRRRRRRTGRPRATSRCSGAQGAGARGHTRRGPRPRHRESPSAGTPSRAPARAAPPSPRPARCCFTKATASTRAATSSDNSTVVRPLCSVSVSM